MPGQVERDEFELGKWIFWGVEGLTSLVER